MSRTPTTPKAAPPLHNGDRLTQAEFHRRYEAYPDDVKIELIGGVVHMASPMRGPHGLYSSKLIYVFNVYEAETPGVEVADGITAILSEESEPQPDVLLRIVHECGGRSDYDEEQYLRGAPELIAEVAHSTVALDMHGKHDDYKAAGVLEYVVFCVAEGEVHWFDFANGGEIAADRAGVHKSRAFPGLWLDGPALVDRDPARLIATLQRGLASRAHAAFVKRLGSRRK